MSEVLINFYLSLVLALATGFVLGYFMLFGA